MNNNDTDIPIRIDRQDAALDEALAESFPASDPTAISFPEAVELTHKSIVLLPWRISAWKNSAKFGNRRRLP